MVVVMRYMTVNPSMSRRIRIRSKVFRVAIREAKHDAIRRMTRYALIGINLTPQACFYCGNPKSQCHHRTYRKSDPLDIAWLCSSCHGKVTAMHLPQPPRFPSEEFARLNALVGQRHYRSVMEQMEGEVSGATDMYIQGALFD